jgi:redox-sensitive bicupin YhaK (pirin superfamily)
VAYKCGSTYRINLPKHLKQTEPSYQQVDHNEFPINEIEGGQIKTIVGEQSPLKLLTPANYLDIQLNANAELKHTIATNMRGFIYMVEGEIEINNQTCTTAQAAFIDNEQELKILTKGNSRFMLCLGSPHNEPIFQHGTFVD